jgi:ankyrin repeat protein
MFVRDGANVEETNKTGMTALHLASYKYSRKVAMHLIDIGANLNARDKFFTVLMQKWCQR